VATSEIKRGLEFWKNIAFENDFREFLFRERNNNLWTNNRLFAAGLGTDPMCTYCKIKSGHTANRESFGHLFFDCSITTKLINQARIHVGETAEKDSSLFRTTYWFGTGSTVDENGTKNVNFDWAKLLFWEVFRYRLWKNRQYRILPNIEKVMREVFFGLHIIAISSNKWKQRLLTTNYNFGNIAEQG